MIATKRARDGKRELSQDEQDELPADGKQRLSRIADATHFPHLRAHYQAVTRPARGPELRESFDLLARYRRGDEDGTPWCHWMVAMRKHHEAIDDDRILIHQEVGKATESLQSWYWNGRFSDEEARPWPFDAWRYLGNAALVVFDSVLPLYRDVVVAIAEPPEDDHSPAQDRKKAKKGPEQLESYVPGPLGLLEVHLTKPPGNLSHLDPFRFSISYDLKDHYDVQIDEYVKDDLVRSISSEGWTLVSTWSKPPEQASDPNAHAQLSSAWIPSQRTYRDYKLGLTTVLTTKSFDTSEFPDHWLWPRNLGKGSW